MTHDSRTNHLSDSHEPLPPLPPREFKKKKYLGHRNNLTFIAIILVLLVMLIVLLLIHRRAVSEMQTQIDQTRAALIAMQAERDHYADAYDITVRDAQAFGRMYGIGYRGDNLTNTSVVGDVFNATSPKKPSSASWQYYQQMGIINTSCIPVTKVVQTPSDTVEIVVVASGKEIAELPRLALLIDGSFVSTYKIESAEQAYKSVVTLPKGTHYVDLVHDNAARSAGVTISLLRIGDRTLATNISVIDAGNGFQAFDCSDTSQGNTLAENGAMRFKIEKV